VWGVTLSGPLPVVGLVRRYRTNYLMGRSLLFERMALTSFSFSHKPLQLVSLCGISNPFGPLSHTQRQMSYVFLTRAPLKYCYFRSTCMC
jgi:hypothetical protein